MLQQNAVRGVLRVFFSELPISSSDEEECRDFSLAIETAHQEVCGNYRKRVTRITARSRRWLDFFLFHFSPTKYCKYTITTIINSIDSLHFHPFPTLKSQGTKQGNDKCERGSKEGRGLRDVVMCAPWMEYGRFWSADLGLLC